jgi:hypothetical protein
MEAYLPPTYYEPRSGLFTVLFAAITFMVNAIVAYIAASYGMAAKSSPGKSLRLFTFTIGSS